ncbi:MAG TPA: YCF48-related protein [Terriglobales bacterium]
MAGVPKIVIERLANGAAAGQGHPDANLLSAFTEQTLAGKDRLQVISHLARCSECRDVVALAAPEAVAMDRVFRPVVASRFSWPVLRWGAAIACIVVVGAAVTLHQREKVTDQTHSGVEVPAAQLSSNNTQVVSPAGEAASKEVSAEPAPPISQAQTPLQKMNNRVARGNGDVIPGRAKDDVPTSAANTAGDVSMAALLNSPRAPRWALTADGSLQRSFDMGRTWEPVAVSLETSLRAVSASGFDIWVGGTNGALYHSADAGDHWMKMQPVAQGEPLTSDVVGVEFRDIEEGRLSTSSGQLWSTQDGGSTWQVKEVTPSARASVR